MTIQSILVLFNGEDDETSAVKAAFELGRHFKAHVRGLHVAYDPAAYPSLYGEGVIAAVPVIASLQKDLEKERVLAGKRFEKLAISYNIAFADKEIPAHHASWSFHSQTGHVEEFIRAEGRVADLVIVSQNALDRNASDAAMMGILLDTGQPVLVVPKDADVTALDKKIALAWNGSREASRAVHASLPFLATAESVQVLTVRKPKEAAQEDGIMRYLNLHEIKAKHMILDKEHHNTCDLLIGRAAAFKASLLVMGAYGYSRFREMVLGGVTEHAIKHSPIPVLLAH